MPRSRLQVKLKVIDQPWCPVHFNVRTVVGGLASLNGSQLDDCSMSLAIASSPMYILPQARFRGASGVMVISYRTNPLCKQCANLAAEIRILCVLHAIIVFKTLRNVDLPPVSTKSISLGQPSSFRYAPIACGTGFNSSVLARPKSLLFIKKKPSLLCTPALRPLLVCITQLLTSSSTISVAILLPRVL